MKAKDLTDLGVSPAMAESYTKATNPAPEQVSEHGQGGGSTQGPGANVGVNSPSQNAPAPAPPPGGNTGSASAAQQGTSTTGPATAGQAGSLNVPPNEPGPPPAPPGPPPPAQDPHLLDWEQTLLQWGFTQAEIDGIYGTFSAYADPNQGAAAALAYARGTATYARLFQGIQQGEKAGLFTDERGYRAYVAGLNETANRFLGRNVTTQEVTDWINQGRTAGQFEQHLYGQSYIKANQNDIQYALGNFGDNTAPGPTGVAQPATAAGLSDLGDTFGGLNNVNGTALQAKLDKAKQRLGRIFQGTLATPTLQVLNNSGGLTTSGGTSKTPDIAS